MRTLMMLAAVVSLTACNRESDRDRDRDRDRSERSDRDRDRNKEDRPRDAEPAANSSRSSAGDPTLAAEIAREVQAVQSTLPNNAGGGVTVERMEANGSEIDVTIRMQARLDASRIDIVREAERNNMCQQQQTRDWFRRGARFNYHVIDQDGETHDFNFNTCP